MDRLDYLMRSNLLTTTQAAKKLKVSTQTLRRWDKSKRLIATRQKEKGYRYYKQIDLDLFLSPLLKSALAWTTNNPIEPEDVVYCPNSLVFKDRLSKLQQGLETIADLKEIFYLISAITGEIGNNSFDHNLGNWPDIPGIFFAYDLERRQVVLADRGQGILQTLKRVKPELANDQEALKTAFTETISGRAPEARGNGLKFVREIIAKNKNFKLFFQTGSAELRMQGGLSDLKIKNADICLRGCLVLIKF